MDLKPCPFCGGKAEMHSARAVYSRGHVWQAACTRCDAQVPGWCSSPEEAAETWDTRHYDRCKVCGRIKEGLLCRMQFVNFPSMELVHAD